MWNLYRSMFSILFLFYFLDIMGLHIQELEDGALCIYLLQYMICADTFAAVYKL